MDLRFGTWNIRSLYKGSSLVTVPKELSKYVIINGSTGSSTRQQR
jgi:hypothetical protein